MIPFSADLKHLALTAALGVMTQGGSRHPISSGLMILSVFMCLAGVIFLMAAVYSMLYTYYTPMVAQFYMGLIVLGCAIMSALASHLIVRMRNEKINSYQKMLIESIQQTFTALTDELEDPIRENPKTAAIIAGLAGYAAGQKLH